MTTIDCDVMLYHVIPRSTTKKIYRKGNIKTLQINQNEFDKKFK